MWIERRHSSYTLTTMHSRAVARIRLVSRHPVVVTTPIRSIDSATDPRAAPRVTSIIHRTSDEARAPARPAANNARSLAAAAAASAVAVLRRGRSWGGGKGPSEFSRTLDTPWLIDSQKMSKFDAARCQILKLKCTKFDFRFGCAPDPAGGAYSAPPDHLGVLRRPAS